MGDVVYFLVAWSCCGLYINLYMIKVNLSTAIYDNIDERSILSNDDQRSIDW